jgi:restriction enzyme bgcI subunit alpha
VINSGILGNCYREFISYGGGDGSHLVVVLAAEHVTTLMAEMVDVNDTDYLLEAILSGLLQVGSSYSLVA